MWNTISCKSKYQEYLKKRQDEQMVKNLIAIKPSINNSKPKAFNTGLRKPGKKVRMQKVRDLQINTENKSLLQRMLRIDLNGKLPPPEKKIKESVSVKSLNRHFREKKIQEIQSSNKLLFKRLQTTESVYSKAKWEESNRFHKYIRDNISRNSGRVWQKKSDQDHKAFNLPEYSYSLEGSFEDLLK